MRAGKDDPTMDHLLFSLKKTNEKQNAFMGIIEKLL